MKIYLAVEVFEDTNWFDGHNMLGAYLTPELALAAYQREADSDEGTLHIDGEPDSMYGAAVLAEDDEGEGYRYILPVQLDADAALKQHEEGTEAVMYGESHIADSVRYMRETYKAQQRPNREVGWYTQGIRREDGGVRYIVKHTVDNPSDA